MPPAVSLDRIVLIGVFLAICLLLDTFHIALITHMIYVYLVTDFGDYVALQKNIWSINLHVLVTSLVAWISQVFFIFRCWKRSGQKHRQHHFVMFHISPRDGFTCVRDKFTVTVYAEFQKYTWVVDIWLGSAALCDILVSTAIVRSLWKSRTGITRTNDLITRLIIWTINTGILTSVWAILDMVMFSASPQTLIHLFFNVMLAKLYANSLLATLNNRRSAEDNSHISQGISLSTVSGGKPFVAKKGDNNMSGIHVMAHTVQDVTTDIRDQYSQNLDTAFSSVDDKRSDWGDCKDLEGDKIPLSL
ncbi:hypothetical protein BU17DRAFT_67145 [Hysterangium stoloniferum]|nr:hypothetical protein BU17DRAFT_67145 [Hysterangium stoloniferum]